MWILADSFFFLGGLNSTIVQRFNDTDLLLRLLIACVSFAPATAMYKNASTDTKVVLRGKFYERNNSVTSSPFKGTFFHSSFLSPGGEKQPFRCGAQSNRLTGFLFIRCHKCGSWEKPVMILLSTTPPAPYCPFLLSGDRLPFHLLSLPYHSMTFLSGFQLNHKSSRTKFFCTGAS